MISFRYHVVTVMSIFISLGIGIVIGGSVGEHWINQKQTELLHQLEVRYQEVVRKNGIFQSQLLEATNEMNQTNHQVENILSQNFRPVLEGMTILVYSEQLEEEEVKPLIKILESVGMNVHTRNTHFHSDPDITIHFFGEKPDVTSPMIEMSSVPKTPIEKWELIEKIQLAVKEFDLSEQSSRR